MGITREQALECCQSNDLIGIGMEADAVRRQLHPENVVTYALDHALGLTDPDLLPKAADAFDRGATGIHLTAGLEAHPSLSIVEQALALLRSLYPSLTLHGLSATAIVALAASSSLSLSDVLTRIHTAGLSSLSGSDAGILDEAVQSPSLRCSVAEWLAVHRAAHALGIPSTAAMSFGAGETHEHRLHHLEALSQLQQETGGFTAMLPTPVQPAVANLSGFEEATAVEYLKTLAITRLVLDTIPHLQADLVSQGLKTLQVSLRFGANDIGASLPRSTSDTTEEDLRRVIRGAGLRPVQRDATYRTLFLN